MLLRVLNRLSAILLCAPVICVVASAAPAHKAEPPVTLPDKYAADKYADLQPFERSRCDGYVSELTLMEKRKRLGLHAGEAQAMEKRAAQIDKLYDRYCVNATRPPKQ
jgi:hypothetical protein